MPNFTGNLRSNEIFSAIYNMIISQQVFSDNIAGTNSQLVDAARVDGTLYGDTKLYYAVDVLKSVPFVQDSQEMLNLLKTHRPADPKTQAITISNFRRIAVTTDEYMTKRAWSTPDAFGQFNSVILGMLNDTKRVIDSTTYNCFIGTANGKKDDVKGLQWLDIPLSTITATGVEKNKLVGEMIAQYIADLLVDLSDTSRDYNDYGFLRSYDINRVKIIFNKKFVNKITKLAMPEIFNKDGLVDKLNEYALPSRFFGTINADQTQGNGTTIRSLIEQDIGSNHYFAGDLIKASDKAPAGTSYTTDENIIAKVVVELPPYMSAFEVSTSFYNSSNLSTNTYLTFGRSDLEYLKNYPMITVHAN